MEELYGPLVEYFSHLKASDIVPLAAAVVGTAVGMIYSSSSEEEADHLKMLNHHEEFDGLDKAVIE